MELAEFQQRVQDSEGPRWLIARWLNSYGYDTKLPGLRITPQSDQWQDFTDEGDIIVGKDRQRCEVKGSTAVFTCAADWKWPHRFIVMERKPWERAKRKPAYVFVVNAARTHVATVDCLTWHRWRVERIRDRKYKRFKDFMIAPLDCVSWRAIKLGRGRRGLASPSLRQAAGTVAPVAEQLSLWSGDVIPFRRTDG